MDSMMAEYARDDAENALDALEASKARCMLEIQAAVDGLASFCGASQSVRRACLDAIADELGDLTYDRREELKELIADLSDQISRADAPYSTRAA